MQRNKTTLMRQGVMVFIGLAALTAIEYWIATSTGSVPLLILIALAKIAVIANYFMHAGKLFKGEEEELASKGGAE